MGPLFRVSEELMSAVQGSHPVRFLLRGQSRETDSPILAREYESKMVLIEMTNSIPIVSVLLAISNWA
jgi:hypothetical protein